jgi:hypothetical protein
MEQSRSRTSVRLRFSYGGTNIGASAVANSDSNRASLVEFTDGSCIVRPKWEQTFSLAEAIEQNKISRIYLGVHWSFDASGGGTVGQAIAAKAIAAFR